MAGQKGQEQDLNQLLKVRRDKLADLQAARSQNRTRPIIPRKLRNYIMLTRQRSLQEELL